jgi:hypothetical protein
MKSFNEWLEEKKSLLESGGYGPYGQANGGLPYKYSQEPNDKTQFGLGTTSDELDTALYNAANNDDPPERLRFIISRGAKNLGHPLAMAAFNGNLENVKVILRGGPVHSVTKSDLQQAIEHANKNNQSEVVKFLSQEIAKYR